MSFAAEYPQPRWWPAAGHALLAHVLLIAAAFAWVAIYAHGIAPGQTEAAYRAYAQVASPWVALLVGLPLFFWMGRRLTRPVPRQAGATLWAFLGLYLASDLAMILALMPASAVPWGAVLPNYASKVLAGWLGARSP